MKVKLLKVFTVLCLSLFAFGCDGGGGGGGGDGVVGAVPPDSTSTMQLDISSDKLDLNTSADDSAEITVTTRDSNNVALGNVVVTLSAVLFCS